MGVLLFLDFASLTRTTQRTFDLLLTTVQMVFRIFPSEIFGARNRPGCKLTDPYTPDVIPAQGTVREYENTNASTS